MRIGLYFGSFNPIHHGHLIIASYILENIQIDQVWFVVSPQNPLKPSLGLLNEYDRLHLINLAIEGQRNMRSCDIEFKLPRPSFTIDTLTFLEEKYPQHEFWVIMGSDCFQNLHHWKNYQLLLKNYPFIIYQRPGKEIRETPAGVRAQLLQAPLLDISATQIRQAVRERRSIRYFVPEAVREEIEKNGYYVK
jgi:nicotinate-nucleotide adenylyltransferase